MKITICTSLALHLLLLSAADKMGSASAPAKPTAIEVDLGKPSMIEVELGGGRKAVQPVRDCGKSVHLRRKQPAHRLTKTARLEARPAPPLPAPPSSVAETAVKEAAAPVSSPISELVSGESTATVDNVIRSAGVAPSAGSESGKPASPGTSEGNGMLPFVISGPPPAYPQDARSKGFTGKVKVKVLISEQGTVEDTVIAQSSGYASLDEAARLALRHWHFSPAYRGGHAVAAWVVVPVTFKLA